MSTKVRAVIMLDFILIMMAATWVLASIYRGMTRLELWYNFTYLTMNIITLLLNLSILRDQR